MIFYRWDFLLLFIDDSIRMLMKKLLLQVFMYYLDGL